MPATLPQETGDHNPKLGWRWRAQNKERNHKEFMDEEVVREETVLLDYILVLLATDDPIAMRKVERIQKREGLGKTGRREFYVSRASK